jgi:hypothetical protein
MSKQGKMAPLVTVLIVFAMIALLAIGYMVVKNTQLAAPPEEGAGQSSTDCNIAPSLSFSVYNGLVKGTGVATIESIRLNGVLQTPGVVPSAFQYGDVVEVFYNASDYIDVIGPTHTMKCGVNTLNQEIFRATSANPALSIFNSDGNKVGNCITAPLLNAGVNQSESAVPISMELKVQGSPLETSGDMIVVIEVTNSTEVGLSDISLSGTGVTDAAIPSFYLYNSTISSTKAFNVPAAYNGALNTYTIRINPKTGMTIGATAAGEGGTRVIVNTYAKQAFIDTDGTFKVGVEDADGTAKYENNVKTIACIAN